MIKDGWLDSAEKIQSSHYDLRPSDCDVSLLVIHNISLPPAEFSGYYVEDFFVGKLNPNEHPYFKEIASVRVSAHLYIRRDGHLVQFVPFNQRAWHAGDSEFDGKTNCNDFSIGIELEGTDDLAYTAAQYQRLKEVTLQIQAQFPLITHDRIKGHNHIAPQRKTDPGESFDWQVYLTSLNQLG